MSVLLSAGLVRAAVPSVINYQGRITDNTAQQNPIDATVTVDFSVWDSATSGTSLWSETQSVTVVKGLFNVLLGSTTPIGPGVFSGGATRYLEIHVSGETLTPRQRIAATPFANTAAASDDAAALGGVAADSYQRRISTPCPAGFSINAVAADGTATCIAGQAGPPGPPGAGLDTGSISGTLTACAGPLEGRLAYVPGRSAVAYSAADGTFLLSYLPPGSYAVNLGSGATLNAVTVSAGQVTTTGTTNLQDLSSDLNNCGTCGNVCSFAHATTSCAGSACVLGTCASGFQNCNNTAGDGCEAGIATDPANCGGCGVVCSSNHLPTPGCSGGFCSGACSLGFADCNGNRQSDGCETSLSNSVANCGGCGVVCSSNHIPVPTCSSSTCNGTCSAGFADCNGNKQSDGCEVNTGNDPNNCGNCGHICPGGTPTCSSGNCI